MKQANQTRESIPLRGKQVQRTLGYWYCTTEPAELCLSVMYDTTSHKVHASVDVGYNFGKTIVKVVSPKYDVEDRRNALAEAIDGLGKELMSGTPIITGDVDHVKSRPSLYLAAINCLITDKKDLQPDELRCELKECLGVMYKDVTIDTWAYENGDYFLIAHAKRPSYRLPLYKRPDNLRTVGKAQLLRHIDSVLSWYESEVRGFTGRQSFPSTKGVNQ